MGTGRNSRVARKWSAGMICLMAFWMGASGIGVAYGQGSGEAYEEAADAWSEVVESEHSSGWTAETAEAGPEEIWEGVAGPGIAALPPAVCGDGRRVPGELCFEERFILAENPPWPWALTDYGDLEAGDLNADGVVDLVHTGRRGNIFPNDAWRLLLGRGAGSFGVPLQRNDAGGDVEVANFNGDSFGDVVAIISQSRDHGESVRIRWGDSAETWQARATYQMGANLRDIERGDLDGDGRDDLIGLRVLSSSSWITVRARNANNDGFAWPASSYEFDGRAKDLLVTDCSGDGRDDVLALTENRLLTYRGTSAGQLAPVASLTGRSGISGGVVATDLDEDGAVDVIYRRGGRLVRRLGVGGCVFGPEVSSEAPGEELYAADFDGDGHQDLATWHLGWRYAKLWYFRGAGNGNLFAPKEIDLFARDTGGAKHFDLTLADFNGDGGPDIAVTGNGGVRILLSNP